MFLLFFEWPYFVFLSCSFWLLCLFVVEKYDLVGRLLKPGEEPTDYTDTEEEHSASGHSKDDWLIRSVHCNQSILFMPDLYTGWVKKARPLAFFADFLYMRWKFHIKFYTFIQCLPTFLYKIKFSWLNNGEVTEFSVWPPSYFRVQKCMHWNHTIMSK